MKVLFTLLPYVKRHKWAVAFGLAALIFVDGLQLLIPLVVRSAVDGLAVGVPPADLLWSALAIAGLAAVIAIGRYLWRLGLIGSSRRVEEDLRNRLLEHIQGLSAEYFNRTSTGELMARATNDLDAVRMAVGPGLVILTDAIVLGVASLCFMLALDVELTLYAMAPMPVLVWLSMRFGKRIHSRFEASQAAFAVLTERLRENLSGIRVVKAYAQEEAETRRFEETCRKYVDRNIALVSIWGVFFPMVTLLSQIGLGIILLMGGRQVMLGGISVGTFVAFTAYIEILVWPMIAWGWVVNLLERGAASLERINQVLEEQPAVREAESPVVPAKRTGALEVKGLTFAYPGAEQEALREVSLNLSPGRQVGIVGRVGSGKSTVVRLITREHDPPPGTLFLDGVDLLDLPLDLLRTAVAVVPQDGFLFSDSVRENLTFGRPEATSEEITRAMELARVRGEMESLREGLETVVGERGVTLSGGQKQRVALARALLTDADLLILDDPFSAVDTETESEILGSLVEGLAGRSAVVIAHRISTVSWCDEILVLERGEVVERGRHAELLELGGVYADLHRRQQLEREMGGMGAGGGGGA